MRCSASLVFASVGAGIGATLFRPSVGQWIGKLLLDFDSQIESPVDNNVWAFPYFILSSAKLCTILQAVLLGTWPGPLL